MTILRSRGMGLYAPNGERKFLTDSEVRDFLQAANTADRNVNLLCQVLAHTGCRLSEALQLTGYNIDLANNALVLPTLKQRKKGALRPVPIPETLTKDLIPYMNLGITCPRLWPVKRQSAYRWIKPVMQSAGLSGVKATTRGLRHGFAMSLAHSGTPTSEIQALLGHTKITTTEVYLSTSPFRQREFLERRWKKLR